MIWFTWLEERHIWKYQIIHVFMDDYIPFCELFIVPYFLWFLYVPAVVLYLAANNKDEYYRNAIFLCIGMTVFLLVSTFFPNGHHLRPSVMPRDNIFTQLVALLYRTDTSTNLWPSIHVYNSIGAHIAFRRSELGKNKVLRFASFFLCVSIILATVFLKQHSVFDMVTAFVMAGALYAVVYRYDLLAYLRVLRASRRNRASRATRKLK
jgi:membrane-associated phospholipid phosphatase